MTNLLHIMMTLTARSDTSNCCCKPCSFNRKSSCDNHAVSNLFGNMCKCTTHCSKPTIVHCRSVMLGTCMSLACTASYTQSYTQNDIITITANVKPCFNTHYLFIPYNHSGRICECIVHTTKISDNINPATNNRLCDIIST